MKEQAQIESTAGRTPAYISRPDDSKPHPGIILIHEVWGLRDHVKDVADRFAAEGYAVLAPDLIAHTGIMEKMDPNLMKDIWDPEKRAEAQKKMRAAMTPIMVPEFGEQTVQRLEGCFGYLKSREYCNGKVGVLGFCFGGTYSYALAIAEPQLNCAVIFYGHAPQEMEKLEKVNCPVLVFNGEKDENLIKQLPEVKAAAEKYHKNFEFHQYPNAGHAFFNDTNQVTYNKEAAADAWKISLEFLSKYLN
jgi:carboxymethylenebutenolidase